MKIYIISIAAVSVVASFVVLLAPEGKSGGISKFLKLLTSLCILAVISDPLISFSKNILSSKPKNIADTLTEGISDSDSESVFFESVSKFSASQLNSELTRLICSKFSLDRGNISVDSSYSVTEDGISFESVRVKLSGYAIFKDPREIESFVTALTGLPCRCEI